MKGGRELVEVVYSTIKDAWENLDVPADWKDAKLITLFKKGDTQGCSNYLGVA